MALTVQFTKTTPLTPQANFVQWTLRGPLAPGDYDFTLYRAGGPEGPWDLVAAGLRNAYCALDGLAQPVGTTPDTWLRPNQLSMTRNFFYRVVAVGPTGEQGEDVAEMGATLPPKQRQLWRKLVRDEYLALRKFTGIPVAVLKRRQWGERCRPCVDKVTKEILRAHCTSCWGTGFVGGFWDPVLTYARRSPLQTTSQVAPEDKTDVAQTRVTMMAVPRAEQSDVLVFLPDNKRFLVDQQSETSIRGVPVHQSVFVTLLPASHVLYKLPVDERAVPPIL